MNELPIHALYALSLCVSLSLKELCASNSSLYQKPLRAVNHEHPTLENEGAWTCLQFR